MHTNEKMSSVALLTLRLKRVFQKTQGFAILLPIFLLAVIFFFLPPTTAFAGTITGISYGPSGSVVRTFVQASDTDFAIFTPITAITSGSTITLTFPSGTTLTSANIATTDFTIAQATQGLCVVAGADTVPTAVSVNESNRTVTLTVASASLSLTVGLLGCGSGQITIKTSALLAGNEVQHPTTTTTAGVFQVDTSVGDTGSISTVSFIPAAANYLKVTGTASMTAGSTNELTITAYDQYDNVVSSGGNNYTGSKSLTFSGPANAPSGTQPTVEGTNVSSATSVTFTNGVSNSNAATLIAYKAETTTVDVSDGSINSTGNTSYDLDLTVNPAGLNDFTVVPSTTSPTTDDSFTVILTARDQYQNTKTDYDGAKSVSWTWASGGSNSPAGNAAQKPADGNQTFTSGVTGSISGFKLVKTETATITATADTKSGTSSTITSGPGALNDFTLTTQNSQTETAGTSFSVTATSRDTEQNTKTNYTGAKSVAWTWTATSSPGGDAPTKPADGNETFSSGAMTKTDFTLTDASETPTITITADTKSGTTASITVNSASANKLSFSTQPSSAATAETSFTTQPAVTVQDQYENTVTASSTSITLAAVLASDDITAGNGTLNATANPLSATSGTATFAGVNYTVAESIKLKATATGLTQALSNTITVSALTAASVSASTTSSDTSTASAPSCGDTEPGAKAPWLYGAIAQDGNSMLLYFTEAGDPVDKYVLQFGIKSGEYSWGSTDIGGKGTGTYLVQSLSPNTTYYFRVRAGNGCASGPWSNEISASTKAPLAITSLDITESTLEPVPCTSSYKIKKGDSLWAIAKKLLGGGANYKKIIRANPTLNEDTTLQIGQEITIPCQTSNANDDTTQLPEETKQGYQLTVKVTDKQGQPVAGAKVTLHSTVQEKITNKEGVAEFSDIEGGGHRLIIAYENYQGEQSINLQGDVEEFKLAVTVVPINAFLTKPVLTLFGVLCVIIIFLLFRLWERRHPSGGRESKRLR